MTQKVQTFSQIAQEIDKALKTQEGSQKIRLPKWVKIVRYIRYTQCPVEYRVVFDIECNPALRTKLTDEKVVIANDLANLRLGTSGKEYISFETYEEGYAYIKNHRLLQEALLVMYRNLKMYEEGFDDFDRTLTKARNHDDPSKMMNLWKTINTLNEAFEKEHSRKVEPKKPAKAIVTLPDYMTTPNPKKEAISGEEVPNSDKE